LKYILLFILLPAILKGQVLISEVLYNEPEGRVRLEWIEFYNTSDFEAEMNGMKLAVNQDTIYFDSNIALEGKSYAIMARQLVSETGDSFEGHWGDSSGIWGDFSTENYYAFQSDFTLPNPQGSIYLLNASGVSEDSCIWNQPTSDGFSWERDSLNFDNYGWHECTDYSGSTPGSANSYGPDGDVDNFDIAIYPRLISHRENTDFRIEYKIPAGTRMTIYVCSDIGRRIVIIAEKVEDDIGVLNWDGRELDGSGLPPGIYIIVIDLDGRISGKKQIPVVIAP
jgi:hypothetical protein